MGAITGLVLNKNEEAGQPFEGEVWLQEMIQQYNEERGQNIHIPKCIAAKKITKTDLDQPVRVGCGYEGHYYEALFVDGGKTLVIYDRGKSLLNDTPANLKWKLRKHQVYKVNDQEAALEICKKLKSSFDHQTAKSDLLGVLSQHATLTRGDERFDTTPPFEMRSFLNGTCFFSNKKTGLRMSLHATHMFDEAERIYKDVSAFMREKIKAEYQTLKS